MKVRLHSFYDTFRNHVPDCDEPFVDCYADSFCAKSGTERNAVAILIEPRSIDRHGYEWIEQNPNQYKYVFTHDSKLLNTLPNAKRILYGGVWSWSDEPKTKYCSMISSEKEMCELHKVRKRLAFMLQDKIDCFGTYNGGERVDTYTSHAPYRYAVVIENYIDDYWFTEKICNCFANKCIPIYYGAKKIDEFFNPNGIIHVNCEKGIYLATEMFDGDNGIAEYEKRREAIEDNYKRVKEYENFESWFFREYESLLESLL